MFLMCRLPSNAPALLTLHSGDIMKAGTDNWMPLDGLIEVNGPSGAAAPLSRRSVGQHLDICPFLA
jgi:hypothetical protein